MRNIIIYFGPIHFSVKNNLPLRSRAVGYWKQFCVVYNVAELRGNRPEKNKCEEWKRLIQKCIIELVEEKIRRLTDVLAFPKCTAKCENVLPRIAKPEVVSKAFRSNIKATIKDSTKYPAIALKEYGDLHIYERPKKSDISLCYNLFNYRPKRYSCYKHENGQLFIQNENSFHKKRKIYSVA